MNEPWEDLYMERHTTEEEALVGHEKACEHARKGDFNNV